jgi:hypothetical protein
MVDVTQNFDVVIPNDNEEEFIERALALGCKEIVFLSMNINYIRPSSNLISVKTAYLLKDISEISQARKKFDYIFAKSERKYFESKVDFILDAELSDRKDTFHYRATGLNQVHAGLARENKIKIILSFSNLFLDTCNVMGKLFQNAVLIKKYKLNYLTLSIATRPELMRSRAILSALESVLGM